MEDLWWSPQGHVCIPDIVMRSCNIESALGLRFGRCQNHGISAEKKLLIGGGTSPGKETCCSQQRWKRSWRSEDRFYITHTWSCRVSSLISWCPVLIPELQVSDWMDLRRDFELRTFNIVDTAIKYGVFGSYTEYTLFLCYSCIWTHRVTCLSKPMGAREWNVRICLCLDQGVALL